MVHYHQTCDGTAEEREIVNDTADIAALDIHRGHDLRYEGAHGEVGNDLAGKKRTGDQSAHAPRRGGQLPPSAPRGRYAECIRGRRDADPHFSTDDKGCSVAVSMIRQP